MRKILYLLALVTIATGCMKVIAGEEEQLNIGRAHRQKVGASASDFLTATKYTAMRVEIQYMEGFAPDAGAVDNLRLFLERYLIKPDGIFIETKQIEESTDKVLSRQQVLAVEQNNRTVYTRGNELGVYLLYTNGAYSNGKILGLAYHNTSAVILGGLIMSHSGRIGQPDRTKLETTVLLHEMGHLLGLINTGSDMLSEHEDDDHRGHCQNKECLMYYRIGTDDRFGYLVRGNIPELDAFCAADLIANGGK